MGYMFVCVLCLVGSGWYMCDGKVLCPARQHPAAGLSGDPKGTPEVPAVGADTGLPGINVSSSVLQL